MDELLSEPRESRGGSAIGAVNMIEVSGLRMEVGSGRSLYGGLHCTFRKGELVCVTGENGSGKTCLLRAMLGAYTNYEGKIIVDGIELRELDLEAFRSDLAVYLPQAPCLFFETADEIMGLGDRGQDPALCESIASRLLASPDPRAFIEARLSEGRASAEASFSGGERQKIAFAAACGRRAQLTLLDEPTSAMDAASAAVAGGIMRELAHDGIVICVSHDEAIIGMADRVIRL
jgi:ABC-type transport system involved in cytochrome bd biosynthesis fused ATPase/permease subunit